MPGIGVLLLGAGRSIRFAGGQSSKLLALVNSIPIVRHAVTSAVEADVGDVTVITGDRPEAIAAALDGLPVRLVHEPSFGDGMAASLTCGVRALVDSDAIMIALGDQPEVRPEAYRRVAARWVTSGSPIVIPRYASSSTPSHPTLFAASVFEELLMLRGDVGARAVVVRDRTRVSEEILPWDAPDDVDTVEDLNRVTHRLARGERHDGERSHSILSSDADESR